MVFVAIAVLWLIYLVPLFLHRTENGLLDEIEPGEPFTPTVTIVRRGVPMNTDAPAHAALETSSLLFQNTVGVSTPHSRAARLRALHLADRRAAIRRASVTVLLVLATVAVVVGVAMHKVATPVLAAPLVVLIGYGVACRIGVARMRADFDVEADAIRCGYDDEEATLEIPVIRMKERAATSVDLTAPVPVASSLLDPIPVTAPTYMSAPLASRTVRTIDLSAPVAAQTDGIPVTADEPQQVPSIVGEWGRVVNG